MIWMQIWRIQIISSKRRFFFDALKSRQDYIKSVLLLVQTFLEDIWQTTMMIYLIIYFMVQYSEDKTQ